MPDGTTTSTAPTTGTSTDTMRALTVDIARDPWDETTGMVLDTVPRPVIDEAADPRDANAVLIRVLYAGFCGSDRGIWWRKSFRDMIHDSLADEGKTTRVIGHEFVGEVVEVGRAAHAEFGYTPGDVVSTESHIICGTCYQCRIGDTHVCADDKIIGISTDGAFADYIKLPARVLWPTDLSKIRPEVAALQEPFGNAIHCCQAVDMRGKSVAIVGTGTIGLFAILGAKALGAAKVIGVDTNRQHLEIASRIGADEVFQVEPSQQRDPNRPWAHDPRIVDAITQFTGGVGADVALEMAGFNDSLNNCIKATRRGGTIILFGLQNADFMIEDYNRVIMNGQQLHAVVGRRIFETWTLTQSLLESPSTGIQDAIFDGILGGGTQTIQDLATFDPGTFESCLRSHPKVLLRVGG
jgi:threonine 3-dehydrogenase